MASKSFTHLLRRSVNALTTAGKHHLRLSSTSTAANKPITTCRLGVHIGGRWLSSDPEPMLRIVHPFCTAGPKTVLDLKNDADDEFIWHLEICMPGVGTNYCLQVENRAMLGFSGVGEIEDESEDGDSRRTYVGFLDFSSLELKIVRFFGVTRNGVLRVIIWTEKING